MSRSTPALIGAAVGLLTLVGSARANDVSFFLDPPDHSPKAMAAVEPEQAN